MQTTHKHYTVFFPKNSKYCKATRKIFLLTAFFCLACFHVCLSVGMNSFRKTFFATGRLIDGSYTEFFRRSFLLDAWQHLLTPNGVTSGRFSEEPCRMLASELLTSN